MPLYTDSDAGKMSNERTGKIAHQNVGLLNMWVGPCLLINPAVV